MFMGSESMPQGVPEENAGKKPIIIETDEQAKAFAKLLGDMASKADYEKAQEKAIIQAAALGNQLGDIYSDSIIEGTYYVRIIATKKDLRATVLDEHMNELGADEPSEVDVFNQHKPFRQAKLIAQAFLSKFMNSFAGYMFGHWSIWELLNKAADLYNKGQLTNEDALAYRMASKMLTNFLEEEKEN